MTELAISPVPLALIETVLNSPFALDLTADAGNHVAALHLVGQIVPYIQDEGWIGSIIAALLPVGHEGDTLAEVPRMITDSVKKGYADRLNTKAASKASAALTLVEAAGFELFHTEQQVGYVAVTKLGGGTICHPIKSAAMRGSLLLRYAEQTGKTLGKDSVSEVLDLLEARALFQSPEEKIHVRVGGSNGRVFYNLADADGTLVKITAEGWKLVTKSPLRFVRPNGVAAQVAPAPDGDLNALRRLLQLDETNWVLFVAFLLICLMPSGPYMLCIVGGDYGSGKSMLSEIAKRIIDPNALMKSRLPKEEHTLAIQAAETHLLCYDNASSVRWDISDGLCAMATGAGFSTRKFFTDDEQRMFRNARPVIINGIGEIANRHDLLDRTIPLYLPRLKESQRRAKRAINAELDAILPGVLGCLFDIVSMALCRLDEVEAPTAIRMVDAAHWLVAAEPATGFAPGTFVRALEAGVNNLIAESTVNDPLVIALFKLLDASGPSRTYKGTVGELHSKLIEGEGPLAANLPKTASHLSNDLQRKKDGMAKLGLMVDLQTRTSKAKPVHIWVEETEATPAVRESLKKLW